VSGSSAPLRALRLVAIAALLAPATAAAHPGAPSLLELEEQPGGVVRMLWKTPLGDPVAEQLAPVISSRCRPLERAPARREERARVVRATLDCGADGLAGASVTIDGIERSVPGALVRISLRDGHMVRRVVSAGQPDFEIPPRSSRLAVAWSHVRLGVEHLATGPDHLAFVLGLALLAGSLRALLATVTAFTAGHSITLSLATLGVVAAPERPVEIGIAASILLVALRLGRPRRSGPAVDRSWALACGFGLLHGLGFAGVLAAIGLPRDEIALSLLSFNVGIELGQLAFLALLVPPFLLVAREAKRAARVEALAAYGIGSLAVYWILERSV
jgi:hydrogenase/urease accessory protein HupE